MTTERAIEIMQNERKCVEIAECGICDRNCVYCDLVSPTKELLEAYDLVIDELKFKQLKQGLIARVSK